MSVSAPETATVLPPIPTTAPAPPPSFTLRKSGRVSLFAAPFVLLGGLWMTPALMVQDAMNPPPVPQAKAAPDGHRLFVKHCANCHGENGDGKGAAQISPAARYFGYQPFKFATTPPKTELGYKFAAPTDDDLLGILKRGIPGSSMPAFQKAPESTTGGEVQAQFVGTTEKGLTDDELKAIIGYVRELTRRGVAAKLFDAGVIRQLKEITEESDDDKAIKAASAKDWADARAATEKKWPQIATATDALMAVVASLPLPTSLPPTGPDALANGKQLFVKATCASCHGAGGKGDGDQFKEPAPGQPDKRPRNLDGSPASPRDLTAGVYKGGGDVKSLYARIRLGIPGTPMPASEANTVNEKDMADLIRYVQSLRAAN